jgi:DNA-binding protein H-NS
MKQYNFESMTTDELWAFHDQICLALSAKVADQMRELERRFQLINPAAEPQRAADDRKRNGARRPYPRVLPKYRNPLQPLETWSGRGKQPRWLTAELRLGRQVDDFRIEPARVNRPSPSLVSAF